MDKHRFVHGYAHVLLWFCAIACCTPASAAEQPAPCTIDCRKTGKQGYKPNPAYDDSAVSIYMDNDIFSSTDNDANYTAGFAVAFSGPSVIDHPLSMHRILASINSGVGMTKRFTHSDLTFYTREVGFAAFTPANLEASEPISDDRPYASLLYLANTQQNLFLAERRAWVSTLSVGILGLPAFGSLQNAIHRAVNTDIAEGWDNQISDGGELTFKYSLARQRYHAMSSEHVQLTTASGLNVGYITEAFYGTSVRIGALHSPWWSFNVYTSNYGEKSDIAIPPSRLLDEIYLIAGANIKLRAYNAFLQGQFRDSAVTYAADEIQPLILEGWFGFAAEVSSSLHVGYIVRMQSSEVKTGPAHGRFRYGEITFTYTFHN